MDSEKAYVLKPCPLRMCTRVAWKNLNVCQILTVPGLFVCLSVCYHVFCHHAHRDNKRAIPIGSAALHWLDFKFGGFQMYCIRELWHENQVEKPLYKLVPAYLDCVRSLCVPLRACIDSRMVSTTVASPCQAVRELLARRQVNANNPAHQLAVPRVRSSLSVCTSVLFHWKQYIWPLKHHLRSCTMELFELGCGLEDWYDTLLCLLPYKLPNNILVQ